MNKNQLKKINQKIDEIEAIIDEDRHGCLQILEKTIALRLTVKLLMERLDLIKEYTRHMRFTGQISLSR